MSGCGQCERVYMQPWDKKKRGQMLSPFIIAKFESSSSFGVGEIWTRKGQE